MKEINDWKAILKVKDKNGTEQEQIAILLPGCTIKGEIAKKEIEIETKDVDISNLTIIDSEDEEYLLVGANKEYLNNLTKCMEYGRLDRDGEER